MATTPQSLYDSAKCFLCFGVSEAEALELALLALIVQNGLGPVPPAVDNPITTEANDPITTETGDNLITES